MNTLSTSGQYNYFYKALNFFLGLAIYFVLDWAYRTQISVTYMYEGYRLDSSPERIIIGKIIVLSVLAFITLKSLSPFIYTMLMIINLFILFPNVVLFENMDAQPEILFGILLLEISIVFFSAFRYPISVNQVRIDKRIKVLLIIILISIVPFLIIYRFDFNFRNLLFEDIYDTRFEAREKRTFFTGYAYSVLTKVIIPVFLIFTIYYKKYLFTLVGIILLVYLFLCGAHKGVLLGALLILAFYFLEYYKKLAIVLGVFLVAILLCYYLKEKNGNVELESIVVRRTFFLPAYLNICYFEFFADNPMRLSHSILSPIYQYPYPVEPTNMIGWHYFNNIKSGANNGVVSDGYMNFGIPGEIIFCVITGWLVAFFDSLNISHKFGGLFIYFIVTINGSALFTLLLTHGGIVLVLVGLYFLQNTQEEFETGAEIESGQELEQV
ncbi:hypothetical protein C3K47_13600 [Solitalea longa]|uniref:Oligosaccharide repeat unit polymerase n=1 Tax=Solitalea longa TaxID=2079460 RepID=A0A2S4ZZK0_9SPHI|nr:hypothetical protein [Solitalea longa]POY35788.1 hypothetical protein C3K47_13600 [Solitalea longa]